MKRMSKLDFYQIQNEQRHRSYLLLGVIFLVYFFGIALVYAIIFPLFMSLFTEKNLFSFYHLGIIFAIAAGLAVIQYLDVRRNGMEFILERLHAEKPDPSDLYHKRFVDSIEEMRISCGFQKAVTPYVIPANAVNAFSLLDMSGDAVIGITEGALARFNREELQAAAAHELAHIAKGDALFVTFACSLGNVFQRLAEALESARSDGGGAGFAYSGRGDYFQGGAAVGEGIFGLLANLTRFLSLFISRQREYNADAAAVEMTRNPEALAQAVYKAHKHYSFMGNALEAYSPIFFASPQSMGTLQKESWFKRIVNSHPPTMERVKRLGSMAEKSVLGILKKIDEEDKKREKAREVVKSADEIDKERRDAGAGGASDREPAPGEKAAGEPEELWEIGDARGRWSRPMTLLDLFSQPLFTGMTTIRKKGTQEAGPARNFPDVFNAFRNPELRGHKLKGKCPSCRGKLSECYYEGVLIKRCNLCSGRLVPTGAVMRIIARRELKPSLYLKQKALKWREKNRINPRAPLQRKSRGAPEAQSYFCCPKCGVAMARRTYNYQYFIEVDECRMCKRIWFDGDELELLQILIEDSGY